MMEDKSVKQLLKEARDAVQQNSYEIGLKCCREILQREKTNYLALVLSAVCFQETEQNEKAITAFKKAVELQPDQPSAWQGLVAFLEKRKTEGLKTLSTDGETIGKEQLELLTQAYHKLQTFYSNDWAKYCLASEKLALLYFESGSTSSGLSVLKSLVQKAKETKDKLHAKDAWIITTNLLLLRDDLPTEEKPLLIEALKHSIDSSDSPINEGRWSKLITLLETSEAVEEARKMLQSFPHASVALQTLADHYVRKFAENGQAIVEEIEAVTERMPVENSAAIRGVLAAIKNELMEAKNYFILAVAQDQTNPRLHQLLYNTLQKALLFEEAAKIARKWISLDISSLSPKLALIQACISCEGTSLEEAEKLAMEILDKYPKQVNAKVCLARIHVRRDDVIQARALLEEVKSTCADESHDVLLLEAECLEGEGFVIDAVTFLEQLEDTLNLPSLLFLAHCQEVAFSWKASANTLVKIAKLYPYAGEVYKRLGILLCQKAGDPEKGLRCLQKALTLTPTDMKIAKTLSDSYQAVNDIDNHVSLLRAVTQIHGPPWAWLRLGLLQLKKGDVSQSVFSLQNAVRTQPNDGLYWEALADAYVQRGSYTAALKAFQKAAELLQTAGKPTAYPDFQIAFAHQMIGDVDEALKRYESVLASANELTLVPSLKGIAETLIVQAQLYLSEGRPGSALDNCQAAVLHLTRAIQLRPDMSCLWTSVGHTCLLLRGLAKKSVSLTVSSCLFTDNVNLRAANLIVLDKKAIMRLAARMFCKAIKLKPSMSALWHNLALAYYQQTSLTDSLEDQSHLQALAEAAAKKAVSLSPQESSHWHVLGLICAPKNPALAQHSWIMSLKHGNKDRLHHKDPVAWTNLGALYLQSWKLQLSHADMMLAHRAFQQAQHDQPDYARAWIGQAMIAESLEHAETMDLFRHTVLLQESTEGAIGYAYHVLQTLANLELKNTPHYVYNIEKMNAIPTAIDAMTRYLSEHERNPCAYNFVGLLFERQALFRQAEASFRRAFALLTEKGVEQEEWKEQVQTNLARVLNAMGKHEESVVTYSALVKSEFYAACGLGLAHYKANHPEDACATYEAALEWLVPDEANRSHLLVALAALAIRNQNYDKAQNLLFESCSIEPASIHGVFALASLGLLQSDSTLTDAALSELKAHWQNSSQLPSIALLLAAKQVTAGENRLALREWSKALHARPDLASLWYHVCVHLAQQSSLNEGQNDLLWRCASKASQLELASSLLDVSLSQVTCLSSLGHLRSSKPLMASRLAQKAIHMAPHEPQGWMCLLAAGAETPPLHATALSRLVVYIKSLTCSKACLHWLGSYEKMVL